MLFFFLQSYGWGLLYYLEKRLFNGSPWLALPISYIFKGFWRLPSISCFSLEFGQLSHRFQLGVVLLRTAPFSVLVAHYPYCGTCNIQGETLQQPSSKQSYKGTKFRPTTHPEPETAAYGLHLFWCDCCGTPSQSAHYFILSPVVADFDLMRGSQVINSDPEHTPSTLTSTY